MSFALLVLGFGMLILALRAIGVRNLSVDELAQIETTSCPVCRRNLQTIMVVYGLVRLINRLETRIANRLHEGLATLVRQTHKHPGSIK